MENEIKFYTTADVRRILGIGNKTCLDLFHRSDFPCIKVGKSYMRHLNLQTTIFNQIQENSCYSIDIIIHKKSKYIKSFP